MPKESGIGDRLFVGGYDLSGNVGAVNTIADRRARAGEISFSSWFDSATDKEHDALKTLPTTDRTVLYFHGTTVGGPAAGLVGKQVDYSFARGADGSLAATVQALSNATALDWGISLTAGKELFASAVAGTHYDQT